MANRLDLEESNCDFSDIDHMIGTKWGYGALDAKWATKDSFPFLNFTAVAGPTHDRHPPFSWNTTNITDKIPNFLPIETFDFEPFEQKWVLNGGGKLELQLR